MRAAAAWYAARGVWLRNRFVEEVDRVVSRIEENALQFPVVTGADVRRARLKRFPYALFFQLRDETAYVLACFHSSRNPKRLRLRS